MNKDSLFRLILSLYFLATCGCGGAILQSSSTPHPINRQVDPNTMGYFLTKGMIRLALTADSSIPPIITITIETKYIPDPKHFYTFNYLSNSGYDDSLSISLDSNGMLSDINVTTKDKSPAIIEKLGEIANCRPSSCSSTATRAWRTSSPRVRPTRAARPRTLRRASRRPYFAPTWGDTSIFNTCGRELIGLLLAAGYRVIMRPHYQSIRRTPEVIAAVREAFAGQAHFEYVDRMGETESILRSDLLVSDWSAMALEYAWGLEKPVLLIDVPRRIRNPNWRELGIEPIESAIREQVGEIVSPDALKQAPEAIERLLADPGRFRARMREMRETMVFRLGHSLPDGAAEIARLADERRAARAAAGERP